MAENPRLIAALDFILNHATGAELEALASALSRRGNSSASSLNFQDMASSVTRGLSGRFAMPENMNEVTRNMVKGMIRQHEPNLSPEQIDVLLDQWVPSPQQVRQGQEGKYPPEVRYSMAEQFLMYGIGNMPDSEARELKEAMPDWHEKYWNIFSPVIRTLLADAIRGNLGLSDCRARLKAHLRL